MRRLIVILALLLAACGDGTASVPSVAGAWEGDFSVGSVSLDLDQSERKVSGSGATEFTTGGWSFVVAGSVTRRGADSYVAMTWASADMGTLTFEGDIADPTHIVGIVTTGAGHIHAVTLVRAD